MLVIEGADKVKERSIPHRHNPSKSSVAKVWPIMHAAIANADNVGHSIPGHISEIYLVFCVGKNDPRTGSVGQGVGGIGCSEEPIVSRRLIPGENLIFRDDNVGESVACQIDETKIWIVKVDIRDGRELAEGGPNVVDTRIISALSKAHLDNIDISICRQIHKLEFSLFHRRKRRKSL